jgi:hypothetical protein
MDKVKKPNNPPYQHVIFDQTSLAKGVMTSINSFIYRSKEKKDISDAYFLRFISITVYGISHTLVSHTGVNFIL